MRTQDYFEEFEKELEKTISELGHPFNHYTIIHSECFMICDGMSYKFCTKYVPLQMAYPRKKYYEKEEKLLVHPKKEAKFLNSIYDKSYRCCHIKKGLYIPMASVMLEKNKIT